MALPPRLEKELEELRREHVLDIGEDADFVTVIFKNFPLGNGFDMSHSDILLRVPKSYPDAGPDMFWTDPNLHLAGGQIPQSAEAIENHLNKPWRRFSWHRQAWNPSVDNMHGHMEFIRKRLREKK